MDKKFRVRRFIEIWPDTRVYWKTTNSCNIRRSWWEIFDKNIEGAKEGAKLNFKDNAVKEIAVKAINKKTGARGLRSILENILLKTMFDLPSQDNVEEVIIDASTVKGQSQPILVHSKSEKSKTEKTTAA